MTYNNKTNKTFLKTILTTASTLAIAMGAATEAGAAALTAIGSNDLLTTNIAAIDAAQLNAGAVALTVVSAVTLNEINALGAIDVNGQAGGELIVGAQAFSLGVVVDSSQINGNGLLASANGLKVQFTTATGALTLTGAAPVIAGFHQDQAVGGGAAATAAAANNYAGLGIIDFNTQAGTVIVASTGSTFFGNIMGHAGNANAAGAANGIGTLSITGVGNVFEGSIGASANGALAAITLANGANTTFKGAEIGADQITINGGATMTLDSTTKAINAYGPIDGAGTLDITTAGGNAVTIHGTVGANTPLAAVTATGASNVTFSEAVKTGTLTTGTGLTTFTTGIAAANVTGNITFNGSATATAGGFAINNGQTMNINSTGAAATITGTIDGAGTLNITAANNAVTFVNTVGATTPLAAITATGASNVTFSEAVKTGTLTTGTGLTTFTTGIAAANVTGNITFNGSATATAGGFAINNGQTMNVNSTAAATIITGTIDGAGTLNTTAANNPVTIANTVGANTQLAAVTVAGTASTYFDNTVVSNGAIALNGTGVVTFYGNTTAGGNFSLANGANMAVDSTTADVTITGAINSDGGANNGTLTINAVNQVVIENAVGTTALAGITVAGKGNTFFNNTVASNGVIDLNGTGYVVFYGDTNASAFTLAANSIMAVDSTTRAVTITGDIDGTGLGEGTLTINAVNQVVIENAVGTTALAGITVAGKGNTFFNNTVASNGVINLNGTGYVVFYGNTNASAFTLADGANMAADSTRAPVTIAGPINGAGPGEGALTINANDNAVTIASAVGGGEPLANISIQGNNNTTFAAVVKTAGIIDASAATLGTVTFANAVTAAGIITSQGTTTFAAAVNSPIALSNATSIVNLNGGAYANAITTIAGGGGTVNIGNNTIFSNAATVGKAGTALTALNIGANSLTIEGGRIFATITGTGTLISNGANNNIIGNIGAPGAGNSLGAVNITDATDLNVTGSIYATIINLDNADATLNILASDGGVIGSVAGSGIFIATLNQGATLEFTGPVAIDVQPLKGFSITGDITDPNRLSNVSFADPIFADTIIHNEILINANAAALTINAPTKYIVDNVGYNNLGDATITIVTPTLVLKNLCGVRANYVNDVHVTLDLTNTTNVDVTELVFMGFDIMGTPAPNSTMIAVAASDPILAALGPKMKARSDDNGWAVSTTEPGKLIYKAIGAPAFQQAVAAKAEAETGETVVGRAEANKLITTTFGGKGVIVNTGTIEGAAPGQSVLSVIDPTIYTQDLTTDAGATALLATFPSSDVKRGFLGNYVENIISTPDNLYIPSTDTTAFAIVAKDQGLMRSVMADAISHQDISGINESLAQDAIKVFAEGGAEKVNEMSDRITESAGNAASTTLQAIGERHASTFTSFGGFGAPAGSTGSTRSSADLHTEEGAGVAAGSGIYDRFGVWGSVNAGSAVQKKRKGSDGFRSISDAIILGADTMINDKTSIGVAVANAMNRIKYKDASSGNKTSATSWIASLYGNHQFHDNWFVRGSVLFNRTHINNKNRRVITGGYGIAKSKYNFLSYGGEVNVGYVHRFSNDIIATPSIGARVLHNNKISYSEAGNTNQNNKNIVQKAMNNYSALAGISVAKTIARNNIDFTPEAHANFQYGINTKTPKGSFVSALSPNSTTNFVGNKAAALNSTYGLSLTGSNDRIEAGISGDVTIASKYVGYQGALKLKVKF